MKLGTPTGRDRAGLESPLKASLLGGPKTPGLFSVSIKINNFSNHKSSISSN